MNEAIKGRYFEGEKIEQVLGPSNSPKATRDVIFRSGDIRRIDKGSLIDVLLVKEGYMPKYSDRPLTDFVPEGSKEERQLLKTAPEGYDKSLGMMSGRAKRSKK